LREKAVLRARVSGPRVDQTNTKGRLMNNVIYLVGLVVVVVAIVSFVF
jgi:hypothetical protein